MEGGDWQATVQRVAKSQTQTQQLSIKTSRILPTSEGWSENKILQNIIQSYAQNANS